MNLKRMFTLILYVAFACGIYGFDITKQWVIVSPPGASEAERFAASELRDYIQKATGMNLRIEQSGSPAIIVKDGNFAPEEWSVSHEKNGDLLITGGRPRGVLYGTYEFIEKVLGCRFFAIGNEYVPKLEKLSVKDNLHLTGTPGFKLRYLYVGDGSVFKQMQPFLTKLKQNGLPASAQYGWKEATGSPRDCHTYYFYSEDFPTNKPELFSLHTDGKRLRAVNPSGPGQVCLTNPEVRQRFLEKLREYIRSDRAALKPGQPAPTIYDISANDNPDKCVCPNCQAMEKKYGSYSGVMLDFINELADSIKKEYPDVKIQTFAYLHTELPPNGIRARDNVIVRLAQLGYEFTPQKVKRDVLRGLDTPNNREALKMLKDWRECSADITLWDYWILFKDQHASPYTNVSAIANIVKTYADMQIYRLFVEAELSPKAIPNFIDLRFYVAAKLMDDPRLDTGALIDEFMRLFYGPAAQPMREYFDYLEKRMNEEKRPVGSISMVARKWLDRSFFEKALSLLDEAEKRAAGHPSILTAIGQERLCIDIFLLNYGERMGVKFNRAEMAERTLKNFDHFIDKYVFPANRPTWKAEAKSLVDSLSNAIPLPKAFEKMKVQDFTHPSFHYNAVQLQANDPEAAGGTALCLKGTEGVGEKTPADFHRSPLRIYIYDELAKKPLLSKVITKEEQSFDEKYHWYYVGTTQLTEKNLLAVHYSWWITQKVGYSVYNPLDPTAKYGIWVSIKLTGPSYVPGSKKEDAVYLDRVIYVINPPLDMESAIQQDPLPEQFKDRKVLDFSSRKFEFNEVQVRAADPEAVGGTALCFQGTEGIQQKSPDNLHQGAMVFYIYDETTKKALIRKALTGPETPRDEKYHWINIGTTKLTEKTLFAAHSSWWITQRFPGQAFDKQHPEKEYEVWVSFKLTGPSYAPGSKEKNAVFIDRVIFAEK